jgi:hypothetical protein
MLFLTAYDAECFSEIGALCVRSIKNNIAKTGHQMAVEVIPPHYPRKPSWFKVDAIRRHLGQHDFVMWIDADAMVIGEKDLRPMLADAPLNICKDKNGINHGIAAWKNCHEARVALDLMDALYPTYQTHRWFEQAALMSFIDLLPHNTLPKHIFNAYQSDLSPETQILHLPGTPNGERLQIMKRIAQDRRIP